MTDLTEQQLANLDAVLDAKGQRAAVKYLAHNLNITSKQAKQMLDILKADAVV